MDEESTTAAPAGLFRRLAALLYDLLLAMALAFAATFALLPLSHGEAILPATQGFVAHAYHVLVLLVVFAYFGWSWTRSGQTLGLKAWRLRLQGANGLRLEWPRAALRFALGAAVAWATLAGAWYLTRPGSALGTAGAFALLAPAMLNYAWAAIDPARRTVLDVATRTRVVRVA